MADADEGWSIKIVKWGTLALLVAFLCILSDFKAYSGSTVSVPPDFLASLTSKEKTVMPGDRKYLLERFVDITEWKKMEE